MAKEESTIESGCNCGGQDLNWLSLQRSLAIYHDRSATAAANAVDQSVNQSFANGMALYEHVTGRAAPSVPSPQSNDRDAQLLSVLNAINNKLDRVLDK